MVKAFVLQLPNGIESELNPDTTRHRGTYQPRHPSVGQFPRQQNLACIDVQNKDVQTDERQKEETYDGIEKTRIERFVVVFLCSLGNASEKEQCRKQQAEDTLDDDVPFRTDVKPEE